MSPVDTSIGSPVTAPDPSRRPSTFGGVIYLGVCAVAVLALVVVALDQWRRGVTVLGVGLLVAAGARLVLSDHEAGMLRVRRNRWVDAVMLVGVGIALIFLAASIPDQPG
ncbi:DUF3017 domain-containing protein [Nocardioides marmoraquaticus]